MLVPYIHFLCEFLKLAILSKNHKNFPFRVTLPTQKQTIMNKQVLKIT